MARRWLRTAPASSRSKAASKPISAGVLLAESFDRKDTDSLYSWSDRRAAYVAKANVVSASTVSNNGYSGSGGYSGYWRLQRLRLRRIWRLGGLGYGGFGYGYDPGFLGGWMFNPMFGMYTYMPYSGFGYSPFGYTYLARTPSATRPITAAEVGTPTQAVSAA